MRIISQVKMSRRDFNGLVDLIDSNGAMENVRSDISIAFSKELIKNTGLLMTRTLKNDYDDVVIFEMEAIVIKMETFRKLGEFFRELGLSADRMERLRKMFIEEL